MKDSTTKKTRTYLTSNINGKTYLIKTDLRYLDLLKWFMKKTGIKVWIADAMEAAEATQRGATLVRLVNGKENISVTEEVSEVAGHKRPRY